MPQFAYIMAVAIMNIYKNKKEDKISLIKLEDPLNFKQCNIKLDLKEYIDAIGRIITFCKEMKSPPYHVAVSTGAIGYKEFSFGFSKILDYYHDKKNYLYIMFLIVKLLKENLLLLNQNLQLLTQ